MRNFGIAHAGAARASVEPDITAFFFRKSYHCFSLSKAILLKLHENDQDAKMKENVLLFELLLEYDLLHVSVQLGMNMRIIEHNENLIRIITWIQAQEDLTAAKSNGPLQYAAAA
jgi:hypothetical protein